jgi:uncharacterized protein with PIN domain
MRAFFRFYGALNDFLPPARRQLTQVCSFTSPASIKDSIEALGVPHPEVDRLSVNGELVDFRYLVRDGDRVAVFPPFHVLDLGGDGRLVPTMPDEIRFVADVHLGRLAAYLRLAGFDTEYRTDASDEALAAASAAENRVLLTRDVNLLKRSVVTRGYFVRNTQPARQVIEVLRRFECVAAARPFTRCPRCNGLLKAIDKALVLDRVPPRTRECQDVFSQCTACTDVFSQCTACTAVYWQGSHYDRIRQFLELAFRAASAPTEASRS